MSKFPELTDTQREPLFALGRYQREKKEDQRFQCGPFNPSPIRAIIQDKDVAPDVIAKVHPELLSLWHRQGYVESWPTGTTSRAMILCQEALDYQKRMSKPPVLRRTLNMWDEWATEWRAGFIALIVADVGTSPQRNSHRHRPPARLVVTKKRPRRSGTGTQFLPSRARNEFSPTRERLP